MPAKKALRSPEGREIPGWRPAALQGLGDAVSLTGHIDEALPSYLEAADLWIRLNWRRGEAEALLSVGYARCDLDEEQKAVTALTRAETLWRALGDKAKTADSENARHALRQIGRKAESSGLLPAGSGIAPSLR